MEARSSLNGMKRNYEELSVKKNFYFKAISLIALIALFCAVLLDNNFIMLVFIAVVNSAIIFFPYRESLYLLMLFSPFSTIIRLSNVEILFYFTFIFSFLLSLLLKKVVMITKSYLLYLLFLFLCCISYDIAYTDFSFVTTLTILGELLIFMIIVQNCNKAPNFVNFYFYGFIISSVFSLFKGSIPLLNEYLKTSMLYYDNDVVFRFGGMIYDTNFYAMHCLVLICYFLRKLYYAPSDILSIIKVLILTGFGLMTMSKMFIICLAAILFFCATTVYKIKFRTIITVFIGAGIIYFVISLIIDKSLLQIIMERFREADSIASFTTQRSDLWKMFFKTIFSGGNLLFGHGINQELLNGHAAHNTYLQLLYEFGIVGSAVFICYIVSVVKNSLNLKKVTHIDIWPAAILGICIFALSAFSHDLFFILLSIVSICFIQEEDGNV